MLPELSSRLAVVPVSSDLERIELFIVKKDGQQIAGLGRVARSWVLTFEQGDPLTFSKTRQVVRFLNQLV